MNFFKHASYYFIVLVALVMLGCQGKDGDPGPQGDPGAAATPLTADITGFVRLFNASGVELVDKSGVTVEVEGMTPAKTTTTNAQGSFKLTDLAGGNYILIYSKAGYGTYRRITNHTGGSTANFISTIVLGQIPTIGLTNLSLSFPSVSTTMQIIADIDAVASSNLRVRYFMGTTDKVSSTNYLLNGAFSIAKGNSSATLNTSTFINSASFEGATSGTTIYVKAYTENGSSASSYIDANTGLTFFPALGSGSAVATYVIP